MVPAVAEINRVLEVPGGTLDATTVMNFSIWPDSARSQNYNNNFRGRGGRGRGRWNNRYSQNNQGNRQNNAPNYYDNQRGANSTENEERALQVGEYKSESDYWLLDSACSSHYTYHKEWFKSFEQCDDDNVCLGDNHRCKVEGVGTIRMKTHNESYVTLTNVKYVPTLRKNLISLGYLESKGYTFSAKADSGELKVSQGNLVVLKGTRMGSNLYRLVGTVANDREQLNVVQDERNYKLWHYRLGHLNDKDLAELSRLSLIPQLRKDGKALCKPCIYSKQKQVSFGNSSFKSERPLELVHSDVCGPVQTESRGGARSDFHR